jgi:hypothetical protein
LESRGYRSNSFVIRIWWEEGKELPTWRGWVQHAASGQSLYFRHMLDLLAFVEAHTGPLAQAPDVASRKKERLVGQP